MSTTTTDLELRIRTALEGIEKVTGFRVELSKTGETAAGLTDSARKLDTALEGLADLQQQIDSYRTLEARLGEVATALEAARDKQRGLSTEIAASLGPSQRQLAEQAKANAEVARAETLLERVRETQRALSAEVAASLGPSKQQLAEQQRANEAVSQAAALLAQAREQQRALSAEVAASLGPSKQQTAEKANATAAVVKLEAQLNKAREQQRDYTQQVIAADAPNGRLLQKQAESTSRLEALERKLQIAKQRQLEANAAVEAGSEPNAELTKKHEAATAQLESLGKALNATKQRQQEANAAVAAGSEPSAALIKRHETATARLEAMERALIMARQRQTEANAAVAAGSEPTQQQIKNHERATDEVAALSAQLKHLQGELQREAAALTAAGVQTNQLNAATQRIGDTFAEVQAKAKAFADAQANLKLIPHEQLKREAQALKDSYAVLQSSGKLTAQELAQANLRLQEGLIELERRTNGWKDALVAAKFEIGAAIAAFAPIAYSIKQASDFETALAGVRKVVDGSDEQFASLTGRIRELAKELPISAAGLAEIAAAGGQLGVPIDKLDQFVVLAAKVATAFSISAAEAGLAVAKLANVFDLPLDGVEQLGDAINVLGNSTAATEAQLLQFLVRVGGSAKTFGISAEATAALGASLISLGKPPEIAANAVNKLLTVLQAANVQSPKAQAALDAIGLSAGDLAARIRENPQAALEQFLVTLQKLDGQARAEAIAQILGTEYNDDISLLVNSLGQYRSALSSVNDQQKIAGSLQREADKQAEQTKAQYQQLKNVLNDIVLELGTAFLPTVKAAIAAGQTLAEAIGGIVELAPGLAAVAVTVTAFTTALSGLRLASAATQVAVTGLLGTLKGSVATFAGATTAANATALAITGISRALALVPKLFGIGIALAGAEAVVSALLEIRNVQRELATAEQKAQQELQAGIDAARARLTQYSADAARAQAVIEQVADGLAGLSAEQLSRQQSILDGAEKYLQAQIAIAVREQEQAGQTSIALDEVKAKLSEVRAAQQQVSAALAETQRQSADTAGTVAVAAGTLDRLNASAGAAAGALGTLDAASEQSSESAAELSAAQDDLAAAADRRLQAERAAAAGSVAAAEESAGAYDQLRQSIGSAGMLKDLELLRQALNDAFAAGKIGAEDYQALLDLLKSKHKELEEGLRGISGFAQEIGQYYAAVNNQLQQLSDATLALFTRMETGVSPQLPGDEFDQLRGKIEEVNRQIALTSQYLLTYATPGLGVLMEQSVLHANQAQRAFYEQLLAAKELQRQLETNDSALGRNVQSAELLADSFNLLDQQDLAGLRSAISDAQSRLDSLRGSAESTLAGLSDELDRLEGREEDIVARRRDRQREEIETQLDQARTVGDQQSVASLQEALRKLDRVRAIELESLRTPAPASAPSTPAPAASTSTPARSEITINIPAIGRSATVSATPTQAAALQSMLDELSRQFSVTV